MNKSTLECIRHRPEVVVAFVQRLIQGYQTQETQAERRTDPRIKLAIPISVDPIDSNFRSLGARFQAVTKDISTGGLAILHSEPMHTKYAQIDVSTPDGEQMSLLVQVKHCTAVETDYHIGTRFVVDWSSWREEGRGEK